MPSFVPRRVFPTLDSLPRSYFLGHHRSGLNKMKSMLSYIDLVIECRDYRVPLSSRNPLFEAELGGRQRLILYTKQDLGRENEGEQKQYVRIIREIEKPTAVLCSDHRDPSSIRRVLKFVKEQTSDRNSLSDARMMVVGMPNVGKSSLLNALRNLSMHKGKAARTGDQPGVTRKIGSTVKIIEGREGTPGVYLIDTPGVFIPYIPNAESMLKLALCGSVKDSIIAATTLADYLLYQLNKFEPGVYSQFLDPTNDVNEFLDAIARKTGRLQKGGVPDLDAAAVYIIGVWRRGQLGRFVLDDMSQEGIEEEREYREVIGTSLSQGRREEKKSRALQRKPSLQDAG